MPVEQDLKAILINKFRAVYGVEPEIVAYAPGRVEILGNHTDYNEGYVFSTAINFGTYFAVAGRTDGVTRVTAGDVMETVEFIVSSPEPSRMHAWSNYVKGVQAGINALTPIDKGVDAMFLGNIPLGAGLSSSAALEISAGLALSKHYGVAIDRLGLAKIGQQAEHRFAGVNCGIMDQVSSLFGQKDALVLSDFRTLDVQTVPLEACLCFLICNTSVKHALVDGAYNERREGCERATRHFAAVLEHPVKALRDVTWAEWKAHKGGLDDVAARRAAHIIGENERVLSGADLLRNKDFEGFGRLMFESHDSSRRFFENSCPELDALVDAAQAIPGVLGARLTGGGFGGSVVVLARADDVEEIGTALRSVYARKFGARCDTRVITCSEGAKVVG